MKKVKCFGQFVVIITCFLLLMAEQVIAKEQPEDNAKTLSGISILGNKEAPKSLFIVPWKSSEIGVENSLSSDLLNEKLKAVDKDVFKRELEFYSIISTE